MISISSDDLVRVGILTIGNEVLDGLVLDTNANWLDKQISKLGLHIVRHATVRDTLDEIGYGIDFLRQTCDIIVSSGGLGPTFDDMTLKAVALHFDLELEEHPEAIEIIKRQYKMLWKLGIVDSPDMTESRLKMGILPKGAIPLDNTVGGAPGVRLSTDSLTVFCLPGVPKELKSIFEQSVLPWLMDATSIVYREIVVDFPLRDETVMAPYISKIMDANPGVYIKSMPKPYGTSPVLRVWISVRGEKKKKLDALLKKTVSDLEQESGLKSQVSTSE